MRKKKKVGLPIRTLLALLSVALLLGGAIGGTLAWLTAETTEVTNTFTPSNITIDLNETTGTEYKMVPGNNIPKNPYVTVQSGSEKCYLFVAITESESPKLSDYIEYTVGSSWTKLSGYENIYWCTVTEEAQFNQNIYILAGDSAVIGGENGIVTVKEEVTKTLMDDIAVNKPTLTFNACAVQYDHIEDVDEAWSNVPDVFNTFAKLTPVIP